MEAGRHAARGPTAKAEERQAAAQKFNEGKKVKKFCRWVLTNGIYKYIFVYTEAELLARKHKGRFKHDYNQENTLFTVRPLVHVDGPAGLGSLRAVQRLY